MLARNNHFVIETLSELQFPLVNHFYKSNGHKGKAKRGEMVFTIKRDSDILGAVRLCPKRNPSDTYWLLRSLWVATGYRGQGMGSQLLNHLRMDDRFTHLWCYPYSHLQKFYERNGFQIIQTEQSPDNISGPFLSCLRRGEKVLLMMLSTSGKQQRL